MNSGKVLLLQRLHDLESEFMGYHHRLVVIYNSTDGQPSLIKGLKVDYIPLKVGSMTNVFTFENKETAIVVANSETLILGVNLDSGAISTLYQCTAGKTAFKAGAHG